MWARSMFWKNKKLEIDGLGTCERGGDSWCFDTKLGEDKIYVELEGSKIAPNTDSIDQAKLILKNIGSEIETALKYIEKEDIKHFTNGAGEMKFSSIFVKSEKGKYDLEFDFSLWEDAYVVVHFENHKPNALSLGD